MGLVFNLGFEGGLFDNLGFEGVYLTTRVFKGHLGVDAVYNFPTVWGLALGSSYHFSPIVDNVL